MKLCSTCGEFKEESEYYWRSKIKGKRWGTCKECQKRQKKAWYEKHGDKHRERVRKNQQELKLRNQQYVWDYLSSHPCIDCGESNPIVLEFDHIRGHKRKSVSRMLSDRHSLAVIKKEMKKCVVRCANCHRIKTAKRGNWFRG